MTDRTKLRDLAGYVTHGPWCAAARNALPELLDELERLETVLAEIDGHWCDYSVGEFGPDDPEGVAMLARAHALVTGKPTCKHCGHEKTDHERPPEDPNLGMPCELCGCYDFEDALSPPAPRAHEHEES